MDLTLEKVKELIYFPFSLIGLMILLMIIWNWVGLIKFHGVYKRTIKWKIPSQTVIQLLNYPT